jgi:hypothetical protein
MCIWYVLPLTLVLCVFGMFCRTDHWGVLYVGFKSCMCVCLSVFILFIKKWNYPCNRPWKPIGRWDFEAPTFCLNNQLTNGDEVVSFTRPPPFTPRKISGTHIYIYVRTYIHMAWCMHAHTPCNVDQAVALLTSLWEVTVSNLSRDTEYSEIPRSFSTSIEMPGLFLEVDRDRFLPHPFKLILH